MEEQSWSARPPFSLLGFSRRLWMTELMFLRSVSSPMDYFSMREAMVTISRRV